jgi:signal transduction histidine kinase
MSLRLLLFAVLPLLLSAGVQAGPDEREAGLPFLRSYSPKEYRAQDQNWAVVQDPRGVIYVGNNDGVLLYDGVHWKTIRVANGSAVRSLDVDAAGTVYVGARGEFGYLSPGESGVLRYVSLLDRVPEADRGFKDVWRTIVTPQGIVFSSYERLFRWKQESGMKVWKPAKSFQRAFLAGHVVYVQQPDVGLLRLDGDSLELAPGSARFAKDRIYCVSLQDEKLLVGYRDEGLFLQQGDTFKPYPTEADAKLRKGVPYSCSAMPAGGLAVATLQNGALLLSRTGKLQRVLNQKAGLSSDSVTFAYPDREGGLWLALVSGVARVQAPSPLSFFNDHTGLKGLVLTIARYGDSIYAGTNTGLYRLKPSAPGESALFDAVKPVKTSAWSLLSTETELLIGSGTSVLALRGTQLRTIRGDAGEVWDLTRSRRDPALIYASGNGLALLREKGGVWTDGGKMPGIEQPVRKTVEDSKGRLWLGTDFGRTLLVDPSVDSPSVIDYGAKAGLPAGWVFPSLIAGRVVFLTTSGILSFDETARRFSPDRVFTPLFADAPDKPSLLIEDPKGNVWAGAKTYGGLLRRQADGSYQWDAAPLRRMPIGEIYAAHVDAEGVAWAGTADGIVRYNPAVPKDYAVKFSALVQSAGDVGGKEIYFGGAGEPRKPALPYEDNSLRFEFAAPSFEDEARTAYRVYLDGFDRKWSGWTQETRKDYTNLPEGDYVFRVEARNLYGSTSAQGVYPMTVLAPWYRSWWAYSLELLGLAALVWALFRWRLQRLGEQNRWLQKTVDERTAELRENNLKLTEMNVTLNLLNEEKNEFLGIAAHDLKNPLGAIRGYAEMLQEDAEDISTGEVADMAARIKKSANLMFDLVSNLLDVNRIEQGKMDVDLSACDLWDTVRQAVDGYRQRASSKQIGLLFDDRVRAPLVMADAAQLVQIMDNLISNAVKYSPSGKNIHVRVYQVDGCVRAEVRDEGPGISAEDQKRLFGKFARLTARPTAGEHSTGLGLAIVKKLVESMKGKVWCESELGKGAAFIVELPVAVGTPAPV